MEEFLDDHPELCIRVTSLNILKKYRKYRVQLIGAHCVCWSAIEDTVKEAFQGAVQAMMVSSLSLGR